MNGKNIIFNDEKINKGNFYKNRKLSKTNDINVNKILKKENHMVQKNYLNTSWV